VAAGGLHPLAPAAFLAVLTVQTAFAAVAGAHLALGDPGGRDLSHRAYLLGLAGVLPPLVLAMPLLWDPTNRVLQEVALFMTGSSPVALWLSLFGAGDFSRRPDLVAAAVAGCLVGLAVYSLWARQLWRAAVRQFPLVTGRR